MKAATIVEHQHRNRVRISIHAAREGGDKRLKRYFTKSSISIHAAREGGDVIKNEEYTNAAIFQSTPPVKAATRWNILLWVGLGISIHAAREGGDRTEIGKISIANDFNPRRP